MSCFYFSYTRNNCHFNGLWFSLPTIRSEVILAWKNSVIFSSNLFEVIVGKKNTFTGFAYFIFTALFKQKLLQVQSLSNSQEHKAAVCLGVFASRMDIFIIYSQQKGAACLFFCQKNLCVSVASCGDNQKFYRGRMRPLRLFGCSLGSKTLLCCGALAVGIGSYSVKYCFPRWVFFFISECTQNFSCKFINNNDLFFIQWYHHHKAGHQPEVCQTRCPARRKLNFRGRDCCISMNSSVYYFGVYDIVTISSFIL